MEENKILHSLSQMREIKPREDWVVSAKKNILGNEQIETISPLRGFLTTLKFVEKPAFVMPVIALVVFGGLMAQISNKSVPGDALYAVRSTIEQVELSFSSKEPSLAYVGLAEKRLDDLRAIAQTNKVKNLPATIEKFESSVAAITKELSVLVENEPEKALQVSRRIVELQESKTEVEQILGATIGGEIDGLVDTTKLIIENEIADLETRTLTEDQQVLLEDAKKAYEAEDYPGALEKIWVISN